MRSCSRAIYLLLLFVMILSVPARPLWAQGADKDATQTVKGTITALSDRGFNLEVAEGAKKIDMEFAVQPGIEVHGKVGIGVTAAVEYKTTEAGKFQAVKVTVEE